MTNSRRAPNYFTAFLVAFCGLAAALVAFHQHGWVNNDTVLYLEVARLFSQGQWQQGIALYGWPFYPLVIAGLHAATAFDLLLCAQILNVAFFSLTGYFIIRLIYIAGGNDRVALAGVALLIGSPYIAGDVLEMLLRDEGFWAFYLGGIFFLARYFVLRRWRDACLWQVSMTLATLFRIEGIVFQLLLPLMVAGCHRKEQISMRQLLAMYSFVVIAATVVFAWKIHPAALEISTNRLGEMLKPSYIKDALGLFHSRADVMRRDVLGHYLDDEAGYTLFLGLCIVVLKKILFGNGLLHLLLAGYGYHTETQIRGTTRVTLNASIVVGVLIALAIIVHVFVLSSRHIVAVLLPLIIYAAFGAHQLFDNAKQKDNKRARILAALVGAGLVLSILVNLAPKSRGHDYELQATAWLKEHNPTNKPVLYSSYRLRHYGGAAFIGRWEENDSLEFVEKTLATHKPDAFAYVVLNVPRKYQRRLEEFLARNRNLREVSRHMGPRDKSMVLILSNTPSALAPHN